MEYGFCGATATYSRLVDILLSNLQCECCLVFLDDLCVFGNTFEQTCERLQKVFERIEAANLKTETQEMSNVCG